jgi:hypothetical protein
MTEHPEITARLDRIESLLLEQVTGIPSPWLKTDQEAAKYAGYRCVRSFKRLMRDCGVKKHVGGWMRREIDAAMEGGRG